MPLQHTLKNALQHTLQHSLSPVKGTPAHRLIDAAFAGDAKTVRAILKQVARQNTLRHTVTHCNILQHNVTHCNTLQHAATCCNMLQHAATPSNTLQHPATPLAFAGDAKTARAILKHVPMQYMLQHAATCCNMLQHAATCNTLQHNVKHCNTIPAAFACGANIVCAILKLVA